MKKAVIVDRTQPNSNITSLIRYKKSGKLLDMGAGHGRHAVYFSQHGFYVTAVEPVSQYCKEIKKKASDANLKIAVVNSSINDFSSDSHFGVIICAMVLHFLSHDELVDAVHKMQSLTEEGGLNVISAYTDRNTGDFMKGNPYGSEKYLLKIGELRNLYEDWDIIEYSEDWTEMGILKPNDVPVSYHKVNMIAHKK